MKPLLIGISAKAEHGKSTTAAIIKEWVEFEHDGTTCGIFEISEIIRRWCVDRNLLPAGLKRENMTPAQISVLVSASDLIKNTEGHDYWMKEVMKWVDASKVNVAVIPNLRRPVEAQMVRSAGGTVWRINRLNRDGSPFLSATRDPNHELETGLDRWPADFYLYNLTGHGALLEQQIITLYEYMIELESE